MASTAEPKSEQEVIARFQDMRQSLNIAFNKLAALDAEAAEHDLVIKQLEPMDKTRKCFRLIGDVLVERTVAETLPAVKRNREGLGAVMKQMEQDLQERQKAIAAFAAKYKIRGAAPGDDDDSEQAGGSNSSNSSSKPQQGKKASGPGGSSSKGLLA